MKYVLPLLATAAGLALPGYAQETAPEAAPAAQQGEAKPAKDDSKICRQIALEPGSRRKEKVCLTAAEWRENNNPR
jgi:DNA-binding IclR family transcriptional regulator